MTEKETLLHMIKNIKRKMLLLCEDINCLHCCYYRKIENKEIMRERLKEGQCKCPCKKTLTFKDGLNPEQYYIKKYGYESLIEELL